MKLGVCSLRNSKKRSEYFITNSGAKKRLYHVPLILQCVYGCNNERGRNGDREDRSEISGGGERVKIS